LSVSVEPPTRAASVRIGAYSDDVGSRSGSFVQFEDETEEKNARALASALDEDPDGRPKPVAAIEDFQETADAVTGRIEKAESLLRAAEQGQLLNLSNVTGEIDSLLNLFGRLDRADRFEEQLRLMRSLNGLLALALRWLDLIRSLRALLRSAESAEHMAGQAFAHHELGTLHLCAGRPEQAKKHLQRAARLQERTGDLSVHCSTRHNLDSAYRDLALRSGSGIQPPKRLHRLGVLAGAIAIAAASGAGIALAVHDGHQTTPPAGGAQDQSITVTKRAPPTAEYGSQFAVRATGGASGEPIVYSSSGVCTNNGTAVTVTEASGTCKVIYEQAGNGNYRAAPQVTETVTAAKADQSISVTAPAPSVAVFRSAFTVAATDAGSGKPIVYSSSGACTNSSAKFTMTNGSGICTVIFAQAGGGNYKAAPQVTETVTAAKADQSISVTTPAPHVAVFGSTFRVAATDGGSGKTIVYSSSDACTNSSAEFTMNSASGTCKVKYTLAGDSNYKAAPAVTETVNAEAGFGGFQPPTAPKTVLPNKAGSIITVRFTLTDASGTPLGASVASSLAAAVRVTFSGPGLNTTQPPSAPCGWLSKGPFFQCLITTPSGLTSRSPYSLTALQNVGGIFVAAPPYTNAGAYVNPETIFFK
jgi:tetratricopeptide (TPR) repeat protein